jgi:hypothetical protein
MFPATWALLGTEQAAGEAEADPRQAIIRN